MINIELLKLLLPQSVDNDIVSFVEEYVQSITDILLKAVTLKADEDSKLSPFLKEIDIELQKPELLASVEGGTESYNKISRILFDAINYNEAHADFFNDIINTFDREIVNELRDNLSEDEDLEVEKFLYERLDELEESAISLAMAFRNEFSEEPGSDNLNIASSTKIFTKL